MSKITKTFIAIISIILVVVTLLLIIILSPHNNASDKLTIVSTSFPGYDFARAITTNSKNTEVKMLLPPGTDLHSFEPTPQDIKTILNSDIFIYVGGDSDSWTSNILNLINPDKTCIIKLIDLVPTVEESLIEGMESNEEDEDNDVSTISEPEYDEHVWTSITNAITIINKLKDEIISHDQINSDLYQKNATEYISNLNTLDEKFKSLVESTDQHTIIFGDRFPFRYFVEDYGLDYFAAFPGCSEQTEASAKTIAFLIDKIKSNHIPVVFRTELSSGKIADAIAAETNAKVLELHSAHNVSQTDFNNGITYYDIMNRNYDALKEALSS